MACLGTRAALLRALEHEQHRARQLRLTRLEQLGRCSLCHSYRFTSCPQGSLFFVEGVSHSLRSSLEAATLSHTNTPMPDKCYSYCGFVRFAEELHKSQSASLASSSFAAASPLLGIWLHWHSKRISVGTLCNE